ncbi:MAG: hypothetical protein Q8861_10425 [Bacteroidota bacterium]|nr:hypothetical protein [Bacteroidota bacterium]
MNEQIEKKEWISPEIIDLDVMETAGTKDYSPVEGTPDILHGS